MNDEIHGDIIEAAARAAHEVNRAWCILHGDHSQGHWENAPDWQKDSARLGIKGVIAGNTPEQSHKSWLAHKEADGWMYGDVKDVEKKRHPCFLPYADLPPIQKAKDAVFIATARAILRAAGAISDDLGAPKKKRQSGARPDTRARSADMKKARLPSV